MHLYPASLRDEAAERLRTVLRKWKLDERFPWDGRLLHVLGMSAWQSIVHELRYYSKYPKAKRWLLPGLKMLALPSLRKVYVCGSTHS